MYNSGLPKHDVIYIFCSEKYNATTIFYGQDVVSDVKRSLFDQLNNEISAIVKKFQAKPEWHDPIRGFDYYPRKMYTQKGSKEQTDYFTHAQRSWCESMVFQRLRELKPKK